MVPEKIEREIVVAAPVERVWAVLTEAEHIGNWFGDSAEVVDLQPGGRMVLAWEEYGEFPVRIEQVEPPHFLSYRWARPNDVEPRESNSTLVEFTLVPEGDGARLRVVESGFPHLDIPDEEKIKYAEENTEGWTQELEELRQYAERLAR
jgi:uncharacterized protein YndB with AHSA1/START domain